MLERAFRSIHGPDSNAMERCVATRIKLLASDDNALTVDLCSLHSSIVRSRGLCSMWSIAHALFCAFEENCASRARLFTMAALASLSFLAIAFASPSRGEPLGQASASISGIKLIDAILLDKNGRSVAFPKDVVGDRIVVVNFIYTSCQTLCPLASATFKLAQDRMSARLGSDVRLITLTLDPLTDTPQRLREFGGQFEPGPNWLWLTGEAANVRSVLQGLGVGDENFTAHAPATLIGDARNGRWVQINVQPSPAQIEAEVTRLIAARGGSPPSRVRETAAQ